MTDFSKRIANLSPEKRALLAKKLTAKQKGKKTQDPIAIVGLQCRFPQAANREEFWQLLANQQDAISEIPGERWDIEDFYDPDSSKKGKMSTRWGGFVGRVDEFDAQFFGISPREAIQMDPQQRLLLETAWEALEHAGQSKEKITGSSTGVFIGICSSDYSQYQFASPNNINAYTSSGFAHSIAANRISYLFDLRGPSISVDTACSSSLVSLHLACQSLWNKECHLALAGGVNLILTPGLTISFSNWGMMAADGRCKTFDSRADGFVRGEGCAVVVLKRLSDALKANDNILALVRATAINQDGRTNGLTAPNGLSQQAVIQQALQSGQIAPEDITYIEAHGTGTSLGDPIEVDSLKETYGQNPEAAQCLLGSVKTNIGHLEGAAGIAGVAKAVLALQHQTVPGILHFQRLNPHIDLRQSRFAIAEQGTKWNWVNTRYAAVSSFGFGGTNAHIILEEAPPRKQEPVNVDERNCYLLPLSARNEKALTEMAARYQQFLSDHPQISLTDLCAFQAKRRTHHNYRAAVLAKDKEEMQSHLGKLAKGQLSRDVQSGYQDPEEAARLVFVFSGQGAQWPQMAQDLYHSEKVFREHLDHCQQLLSEYASWSLTEELFKDASHSRLNETQIVQPAIFAIQASLVELFKHWGVEPDLVLGHSVGEVAAAYAAGSLSLPEAIKVIFYRSHLMQRASGQGQMVALQLTLAEAREVLHSYWNDLALAAINSPNSLTLSGDNETITNVIAFLEQRDIAHRRLPVEYAFHSEQMAPFQQEVQEKLQGLTSSPALIPLVSTVTGDLVTGTELTPEYWGRNIRDTVRFAPAMDKVLQGGPGIFLEIAPSPVLARSMNECAESQKQKVQILATLARNKPGVWSVQRSLATLYAHGFDLKWQAIYPEKSAWLDLPHYPWQRQKYWLQQTLYASESDTQITEKHPLVHRRVNTALQENIFESHFTWKKLAFLRDHQAFQTVIFPLTGYLEMVWYVSARVLAKRKLITNISLEESLVIPNNSSLTTQVVLATDKDNRYQIRIFSLEPEEQKWRRHFYCEVSQNDSNELLLPEEQLAAIQKRCQDKVTVEDFYHKLYESGLEYGPRFRGVEQLYHGEKEALALVANPDPAGKQQRFLAHPAVFDACLQAFAALLPLKKDEVYLPIAISELQAFSKLPAQVWAHVSLGNSVGQDTQKGNLRIFDQDGTLVLEMKNIHFKRASREVVLSQQQEKYEDWCYEVDWSEQFLEPHQAGSQTRNWLIFSEQSKWTDKLIQALEKQGDSCTVIYPGEKYELLSPKSYRVAPFSWEDFQSLAQDAFFQSELSFQGILFFSSFSLSRVDQQESSSLQRASISLLYLAQAFTSQGNLKLPQLFVVTNLAQPVQNREKIDPWQAPFVGLAKSIGREYSDFLCTMIDLAGKQNNSELQSLLAELNALDQEGQIAFRHGIRYVARLHKAHLPSLSEKQDTDQPLELTIAKRGVLENLQLTPQQRRVPKDHEVEIKVEATGLNFRDVLNVLGMYPGEAGKLGLDCVGKITAVGDKVSQWQVGQEVIALFTLQGAFKSYVTVSENSLVSKPPVLAAAEAAAIPSVFLTAYYGLCHLAKIQAGQKVLIHAAAGGVGLAAVELAKSAGAEIFATAGSPKKRAYLESLGIAHVMDSRSLQFAEEIKEITQGQGVDIVLNSLAGDFIAKSVSVLAQGGCFLEIGKNQTWTPEKMQQVRPDVRYHIFDLLEVQERDPELLRTALEKILDNIATGGLQGIGYRTFPRQKVVEAFRYMAQAKHIGKVIVTQPGKETEVIRAGATYLITGATGGIGLQLAERVLEKGGHLLLLARSEPSVHVQKQLLKRNRQQSHIRWCQADISDLTSLQQALNQAQDLPAIKGVFHAAGTLADGAILQQSWEHFAKVMAPKVLGTWNLHQLLCEVPLDFFVLFSSAASLFGSRGQANYAAANAFLDGFAYFRRNQGYPTTTINWGPWSKVGMASRMESYGPNVLSSQGLGSFLPSQAIAIMEKILQEHKAQVGVVRIDWNRFVQQFATKERKFLSEFLAKVTPKEEAGLSQKQMALIEELEQASPGKRKELLVAHIENQVFKVLDLDPSYSIGLKDRFFEIGMDSLTAVEFKNALEQSLGRSLPSTLVFDYSTIDSIFGYLIQNVFTFEDNMQSGLQSAEPESESEIELAALIDKLETISEEEAEALLAIKLIEENKEG